jgi:hypothetical protein
MIQKDQVFVANVVVTNLMWETMVSNAINWVASVITKLNAIAKIYKNKMLKEGHHFISMAMEMHDAPKRDMDCFIKECACLLHDRSKNHLSLSFYIQFFKHRVNNII